MVAEPSPEYADDITKRSILLDTVLIHALISSSPHRHLSSIIFPLTVTLHFLLFVTVPIEGTPLWRFSQERIDAISNLVLCSSRHKGTLSLV
jgi:hypothetical protein